MNRASYLNAISIASAISLVATFHLAPAAATTLAPPRSTAASQVIVQPGEPEKEKLKKTHHHHHPGHHKKDITRNDLMSSNDNVPPDIKMQGDRRPSQSNHFN